jgi:hypothetical protein
MSSRNPLLRFGPPAEVAEMLDQLPVTPNELRLALINALNRIAVLENTPGEQGARGAHGSAKAPGIPTRSDGSRRLNIRGPGPGRS